MSKNVFANGREISAKSDDNKSIAAMPDVCLTPPPPPAGPIPIPYPNFSEAKDTVDGSKTVQIGGSEVGLKDKSKYSTSKGDEAATKSQGMGVVTATIQGETFHTAWSMDVVIEDQNAIRHMDMTTHNHACPPMNSGSTTVDLAAVAPMPPAKDCAELEARNQADRAEMKGKDSPQYAQNVGNGSTTITNANFTSPGGANTFGLAACSRAVATQFDAKFCEGLKPEARAGKSNVNCPGTEHKYAQTGYMPHTSHTEARLIETIFAAGAGPGGTLTMAINWQNKDGTQNIPCEHCEKVICAAEACGLNIFLCKAGKPTKQKCD
jgi:hypothetical protein